LASGVPIWIWTVAGASSASTSGASNVNSPTTGHPTRAPVAAANSTNVAPATTTRPKTAWSSSQGWSAVVHRPVNTRTPVGSASAPPSNGCPPEANPAAVTSPTARVGSIQYRVWVKG
jgi:hypothetical protein